MLMNICQVSLQHFYGVLDPELFVLSGSVALKIPGFIEEIEKRAKEKVYDALKSNVKIVPAALGEDCGLIGAACLVLIIRYSFWVEVINYLR